MKNSDFSFYTVGKYPNNIRVKMPCDISKGENAILTYNGHKFFVRGIGGSYNDVYDKSHIIYLLYDHNRVHNSHYGGNLIESSLTNNPSRVFDGNIQMSEFLEIADILIIERIHGA